MKTVLVKRLVWLAAVCAVVAFQANATVIELGKTNQGGDDLPSSGEQNEKDWVQGLVNGYNLTNDPDLPGPLSGLTYAKSPAVDKEGLIDLENGNQTVTITVPEDCDFIYVMLKWGGGQTAFDHEAWYLDNVSQGEGGIGLPTTLTLTRANGLSHYLYWCGEGSKVPDAGSTLALLGLGMVAMAAFRRRSA